MEKEGDGEGERERNAQGERREELKVVGMHCATCVATVSKAIKSVKGVEDANVNLASGQAMVRLSGGSLKEVVEAVRKSGYDVLSQTALIKVQAAPDEMARVRQQLEGLDGVMRVGVIAGSGSVKLEFNPFALSAEGAVEKLRSLGFKAQLLEEEREIPEIEASKKELRSMELRLAVAVAFTIPTLIFQYAGLALLSLVFSLPVQFYSGLRFHQGAWRALRNKTTNMDTLVSLASNVAWFYSAYSLIFGGALFFDTASLLISFVLVGKTVEAYVKGKAVTSVAGLQAVKARKLLEAENGGGKAEAIVDSFSLKPGDRVALKSGDVVPADGVIDGGTVSVDESLLTGESEPVKKTKGDALVGGATVASGYAELYVTRSGNRTYLAQVLGAVREAETARLPSQELVDKVSAIFTPSIILASAVTFAVWSYLGAAPAEALLFAVAVLASACPCALGLATPMAVLTTVNRLAKRGITIKDGESLEKLREVKTFVFDKTGTLTTGSFEVNKAVELIPGAISLAAAVEAMSSHPLASAINSFARASTGWSETPPTSRNPGPQLEDAAASPVLQRAKLAVAPEGSREALPGVQDFSEFPGEGVYGRVAGHDVLVGKTEFAQKNTSDELDADGNVVVLVDWKSAAYLWVGDELREGVKETLEGLKAGHNVVVATGDSSGSAKRLGELLGITVYSGLTPDDKVALVKKMKEGGAVAFVGDGVNDAMALGEADVGIAVASGTDIAKYAGDVVIRSPSSLPYLLSESKLAVRKIKENLAWAFGYNSVLVPIAAGLFYPAIYLAPEFAALAMSMSSVFVSAWSLVRRRNG
ncbi:MAG: heavy metal translocating P-type ATPase [Thermoprotei archaeon]